MRVLVTSIAAVGAPWTALATHPDVELASLSASYVDCGEYGVSRPDPEKADHRVFTAPVYPPRPYVYSRYLSGVARALRQFRPDIIFAVGEPSELGVAQVMAIARGTLPQARRLLFSFENVQRDWSGFPKVLRGWAERATLPRLHAAVACTEGAKTVLVARGMPAERVSVIPPGVEPERFHPGDEAELHNRLAPDGRFLIGYVGRLVHEKGVDVLLRAVASLSDDFRLCLIGAGPAEADLRALGDDLCPERLHWLGRVDQSQMPAYTRAFDALVLPSRSIPVWQEQFGRVLVEAMMSGTPVIGSSSGAIPEVIGDAGLIFREEDSEALANTLVCLRDDEALRRQLAARGIERAAAQFTPEVVRDRLVTLFEDLLRK